MIKVVETFRILIFFLYFNYYFEKQQVNRAPIHLWI